MDQIKLNEYSRRRFLEFLGWGTAGVVLLPGMLSACSTEGNEAATISAEAKEPFQLKGIAPSTEDAVILAEGLSSYVLIKWGDETVDGVHFGFNNDFTCFVPVNGNDDGILWVNHEYVDPKFIHGRKKWRDNRTKQEVDKEIPQVGGSLQRIRRENGKWTLVKNDAYNRLVNGTVAIPFNWHEPVGEATEAIGTLANCSGGYTPWGSILTCEENYDSYYGEVNFENGKRNLKTGGYNWQQFYPERKPEHYGWVVEVNPKTGEAKKHVALGRFAHECCTLQRLPDGRIVAYSGDDANDEHLYKFVSSKPDSLRDGTLYVANLEKGEWIPLVWEENPVLKVAFSGQTEMLIRVREAAKLVGATPLDRPEDIEIDPETGAVLVALTNNTPKENYHGSILRINENANNHASLKFTHDTLLAGGEETGFACPDNMAFDAAGNLWFTSDISGSEMYKGPYETFGNNGLFVVPRKGAQAGMVVQVASAPVHAEFTGPWFSPDGKTLFLSVQHPGEYSKDPLNPDSHWPDGGDAMPRSAVICIEGPLLEQLLKLS
jgi:uncharacterized protein